MPIKSYLAYPQNGQKEALVKALAGFPECEVLPAENKDVVIVVTDTDTQQQDKRVQDELMQLPNLAHLGLVAVYN